MDSPPCCPRAEDANIQKESVVRTLTPALPSEAKDTWVWPGWGRQRKGTAPYMCLFCPTAATGHKENQNVTLRVPLSCRGYQQCWHCGDIRTWDFLLLWVPFSWAHSSKELSPFFCFQGGFRDIRIKGLWESVVVRIYCALLCRRRAYYSL